MAGPAWDVAIAPAATLGASSYPSFWVSIANRIMRQSDSAAGKQYELDQAQTGESHHVLDNRDAAFSPVNTSSPYSPSVTAFKPVRWRAQYPATVNVLTVDQATGGSTQAAGSTVDNVVPVWFSYVQFWTVKAESDAFSGPNVFQQILSSAPAAGSALADMDGWTVKPGSPHSAQCVMRATAGGTTPQVRLALLWRDVNGNTISFATGTTVTLTANSRVWQQLTVSGTPPANAAGATLQIDIQNSVAATIQASGFQVEYAASPSTWVQPGTWYPLLTGGAERWPQVYDMNGTYGKARPIIVDAFAVLAQVYPLPAFYSDLLALSPDFFFPLDDQALATVFRDLTGNHNPAPAVNSPAGAGSLHPGQGVSGAGTSQGFLGAPGPVVAFNNVDNTGASSTSSPGTFIELDSVGITGPSTIGNWTRMFAFQASAVPSNTATLWGANQASWWAGSAILPAVAGAYIIGSADPTHAGFLAIELATGLTNTFTLTYSSGSVCDGNWHLAFLVSSNNGRTVLLYLDGNSPITIFSGASPGVPAFALQSDTLGETRLPGNLSTYQGLQANLAHIAQWSTPLNSTQLANLYTSWKTGWSGESSGARYARILNYAGYLGATNLQTGATTSMGPAKDIDGVTSALTLLENVVTTESGTHYVDANGTIRFESRSSRYNQLTPVYTFGENTAGGEWPYEDVAFDFDTTRVVGQAQITQFSTGQVFVANSPTTLAPNYRPTFQRTINVTNPQEGVDAANYMASRYQKPLLRVQTIRLHPSAVAGMWPVALALSISTRVRVMRRAPGAPPIQFDGFIENIKWGRDWDTGDTIVDLQISPANLQQYWVLAALHTTLQSGATAGTNTITCNPLTDSASNPAAASFCSGLQITLDPGNPALAETLTVASFGATSPGYTSFTITFTTNMAHNHAINAVVCEQLPAGVTDPTTWDSASVLGTTTTLSY